MGRTGRKFRQDAEFVAIDGSWWFTGAISGEHDCSERDLAAPARRGAAEFAKSFRPTGQDQQRLTENAGHAGASSDKDITVENLNANGGRAEIAEIGGTFHMAAGFLEQKRVEEWRLSR